jgi:hypothetical protein
LPRERAALQGAEMSFEMNRVATRASLLAIESLVPKL